MRQRKVNPQVWTDFQQANERLQGTVILYDKYPVYITSCAPEGTNIQITGTIYKNRPEPFRTVAIDPNFHRFKKFPPTGWVNSTMHNKAVYVDRFPIRSRSHGMNDQNTRMLSITDNGRSYGLDERYTQFVADRGYGEACNGVYPSLDDVLAIIRNDTVISVSPKFSVFRDDTGMRWLYRNLIKVGLFIGADSLILLEGRQFYKEEIHLDPAITTRNIKEF